MRFHRRAAILLGLLALPAAAPPARAAGIHLALQTVDSVVAAGDTIMLEANVTPAGDTFNAFDLVVGFDPTRLALVPTTPVNNQRGPLVTGACTNTFHVFTPGAGTETANLSLLCANTFMAGPGVIYRIRFRTLNVMGPTTLRCQAGTQFFRAGVLVTPLVCDSLALYVGLPAAVSTGGDGAARLTLAPPQPNPRQGAGSVRLAFTLPVAGAVRLELFDLVGRRRAERRLEGQPAGPRQVDWALPEVGSGVYFLRVTDASGTSAVRRWVVER